MKRNNVFLYSLQGRVIFPYNEYQVSLNSNLYDCTYFATQRSRMTT